jgi:hypothetical protein
MRWLERQRLSMAATCGHEPTAAHDRCQQPRTSRQPGSTPIPTNPAWAVEHRHCLQRQPHENTAGIECVACGNDPVFVGTLTDTAEDNTEPPAPVRDWLTPNAAMPPPPSAGHQRRPNQLHGIRTPQQHRDRHQHLSHQTPPTPRSTGATPPPPSQKPLGAVPTTTDPAHPDNPGRPPARTPTATRPASASTPHHQMPPCIQHGPPAPVRTTHGDRAVVVSSSRCTTRSAH